MKKILIAGNWKMNLNVSEASLLLHHLQSNIPRQKNIEIILAPPMLSLQPLSLELDRRKFRLAAQNAYFKDSGAFTGEVSFSMLRNLVHYVIVGHSERRRLFNEDLPTVTQKVHAAFRNNITPILCLGETLQERKDGDTKQVVHDQLTTALRDLTASEVGEMVIAYEPVWAIGGDTPATPADCKSVTRYIRKILSDTFGEEPAREARLLYGGSVTPQFVRPFLDDGEVDGFLVGHESLNYHDFSAIVSSAHAWQREGN